MPELKFKRSALRRLSSRELDLGIGGENIARRWCCLASFWAMAVACSPQIYRRRRPERSVLYRALMHHFDRFEQVYEERFEAAFGFFRSVMQRSVFRFLDCGISEQGFARLRCKECQRARQRRARARKP